MQRTYEAVLIGNRLEWKGDAPDPSMEWRVTVTVLPTPSGEPASAPNGARVAAAMEKAAAMGGIASIPDPSEWQREIRKDRPLPGRE